MKINIHLDDSLKAMESMPDKKYGLSIVDVPYGIDDWNKRGSNKNLIAGKNSIKLKQWDKKPNRMYFEELFRVSKKQVIWGANHFIEYLFNTKSMIIWDKKNVGMHFNNFELAWTKNIKEANRIFRMSASENREDKIHPTQKPVALYKWLLKNYGFNKDGSKRTIFDSHGGSLSIVIACIDMGFDIDIWEIDPDYYRDGVNRVKRHLDQLDLTREPVEINIK